MSRSTAADGAAQLQLVASFEHQVTGVMIFAGGIPLRLDDLAVLAVGVSGGSGEQDQTAAEAAAAAF